MRSSGTNGRRRNGTNPRRNVQMSDGVVPRHHTRRESRTPIVTSTMSVRGLYWIFVSPGLQDRKFPPPFRVAQIHSHGAEIHAEEDDGHREEEVLDPFARDRRGELIEALPDVVAHIPVGTDELLEASFNSQQVPLSRFKIVRIHIVGAVNPDLAADLVPVRVRLVQLREEPVHVSKLDDGVRGIWNAERGVRHVETVLATEPGRRQDDERGNRQVRLDLATLVDLVNRADPVTKADVNRVRVALREGYGLGRQVEGWIRRRTFQEEGCVCRVDCGHLNPEGDTGETGLVYDRVDRQVPVQGGIHDPGQIQD